MHYKDAASLPLRGGPDLRRTEAVEDCLGEIIGAPVRVDVPLSEYTTFRIGGPARYLCVARTAEQLARCLEVAKGRALPVQILGGGSNVLFDDGGFDGLVVVVAAGRVEVDGTTVWAEGGARLSDLVDLACRRGLAGLAFAAGIPGSVGGALAGNAGAYGKAVGDRLVEAVLLSRDGGTRRRVGPEELGLGYRESAIARSGEVVESVTLSLEPGDLGAIWNEVDAVMARRRERLPGPDLPSAGSFFKNLPPEAPGGHRLPAGQLLDECGCKGLQVGGAQVYEKHANIIVNRGRATAAEVLRLVAEMKRRVRERFGVTLEPEVKVLVRGA